jgi:hypothetical protein
MPLYANSHPHFFYISFSNVKGRKESRLTIFSTKYNIFNFFKISLTFKLQKSISGELVYEQHNKGRRQAQHGALV